MNIAASTIRPLNKHGVLEKAESFWIDTAPGAEYPELSPGISIDVAIVGGGFAGIASALLLKEGGLKVAVIEARRVVKGVTGYTTAKVTSLHRLIYKHLIDAFGKEQAGQYAEANQAAIDKIEAIVRERKIDCDFSRLPFFTFAETDQYLSKVEQEVKAAQSLGLPASFVQNVPLPFMTKGAIRLENQAQFHPRKYLLALASIIPGDGSYIFENTRVVDLKDEDTCTIITDKGNLKARQVIIATNFPIHDKESLYFARMEIMRSYVLGIRTKEVFSRGMFINAEEDGHSFRAQSVNGGEIVVIGGQDHLTGHEPDTVKRYQNMEKFVNYIYNNPRIEYSWSTQDNITVDKVPFIGKLSPVHKHLWVATGFGQWGMTTSMVSAMLLSDLIQNRSNPRVKLFSPSRLKPDVSAAKKTVTQNVKVVQKFIKGHVSSQEGFPRIDPEEGRIVKMEKKRAAAYRNGQGQLYILNPNCTHMGCVVTWNNAEKTWDCPCHGSRYDSDGKVIQSPAVKDLVPLTNISEESEPVKIAIAKTADLPIGKMLGIETQGRKILVSNVDSKFYAIGNVCTHMGCLLSEGNLDGEKIHCRCHGSTFDVRTGEVINGPARKPEPVYELKAEGDRIVLIG